LEQRLEQVEVDFGDDETIFNIVEFAKNKTRFPLCQPSK